MWFWGSRPSPEEAGPLLAITVAVLHSVTTSLMLVLTFSITSRLRSPFSCFLVLSSAESVLPSGQTVDNTCVCPFSLLLWTKRSQALLPCLLLWLLSKVGCHTLALEMDSELLGTFCMRSHWQWGTTQLPYAPRGEGCLSVFPLFCFLLGPFDDY